MIDYTGRDCFKEPRILLFFSSNCLRVKIRTGGKGESEFKKNYSLKIIVFVVVFFLSHFVKCSRTGQIKKLDIITRIVKSLPYE